MSRQLQYTEMLQRGLLLHTAFRLLDTVLLIHSPAPKVTLLNQEANTKFSLFFLAVCYRFETRTPYAVQTPNVA